MILIRIMGGLGNQMFQYAVGKALAYRNKTDLKVDLSLLRDGESNEKAIYRDYELGKVFGIEAAIASNREVEYYNPTPHHWGARIVNRLRNIVAPPQTFIEQGHRFNPKVLDLSDNYCLVGTYQSPKYFAAIENNLRQDFSFQNPLSPKAQALVSQMKSVNAISLNVRRGDYVKNPHYRQILGFVGLEYYARALAYLKEYLSQLYVFIFSDDIDWCQQNMTLDIPHTFVTRDYILNGPEDDLQMMSHCQHFILANSTFAWWGAWLSRYPGKIVITPSNWSADGSLDTQDLVYPHWIRL